MVCSFRIDSHDEALAIDLEKSLIDEVVDDDPYVLDTGTRRLGHLLSRGLLSDVPSQVVHEGARGVLVPALPAGLIGTQAFKAALLDLRLAVRQGTTVWEAQRNQLSSLDEAMKVGTLVFE